MPPTRHIKTTNSLGRRLIFYKRRTLTSHRAYWSASRVRRVAPAICRRLIHASPRSQWNCQPARSKSKGKNNEHDARAPTAASPPYKWPGTSLIVTHKSCAPTKPGDERRRHKDKRHKDVFLSRPRVAGTAAGVSHSAADLHGAARLFGTIKTKL